MYKNVHTNSQVKRAVWRAAWGNRKLMGMHRGSGCSDLKQSGWCPITAGEEGRVCETHESAGREWGVRSHLWVKGRKKTQNSIEGGSLMLKRNRLSVSLARSEVLRTLRQGETFSCLHWIPLYSVAFGCFSG